MKKITYLPLLLVIAFFIVKCTSTSNETNSTEWLKTDETEEFPNKELLEPQPATPSPLVKIHLKTIERIKVYDSSRIISVEYLLAEDHGNIYWGCPDSIFSAEMSASHSLFQVTSYDGTVMSAILLKSKDEAEIYAQMLLSELKKGSRKKQAFKYAFGTKLDN
jgi:hypothetical protein